MVSAKQIHNDIIYTLKVYHEFNQNYLEQLVIHENLNTALKNVDAIAVLTEWEEFIDISNNRIIEQRSIKIFDGRNIVNNIDLVDGYAIGKAL